jgi:signal peptidase II
MSSAWRWFALAALVVLADQATKALVLARFAFSFLSDAGGWQKPLLIAFAVGAAALVSFMIVRRPRERLLCSALALILGGALGNVIDRLRFGQVVDFLDAHAGGYHWPAFNVADSAITIGALLLILEGFVHRERRARSSA